MAHGTHAEEPPPQEVYALVAAKGSLALPLWQAMTCRCTLAPHLQPFDLLIPLALTEQVILEHDDDKWHILATKTLSLS
jgi:hypothetical protein